jgi:hypothetical protein
MPSKNMAPKLLLLLSKKLQTVAMPVWGFLITVGQFLSNTRPEVYRAIILPRQRLKSQVFR